MTAEIITDPVHGLELLRRTYTRCDDPDPDLPVVVSLFSGIEGIGAGLALNGFQVVVAVEYDPECQRVLRARFPEIVIYSDVREVDPDEIRRIVGGRRVVLTGGFPCQDLSVAGGRAGLAGERSGLYRELLRIADALDPDWIIIENVAGLLSADIDPEANDGAGWGAGTAMALLLGDVTGYRPAVPAGGWRSSGMCVGGKRTLCWRVLDARHFGVAQRRRRVFVVACPRDRSAPAAVLLEPEGVRGDPPPGEPPRPRSARRASPSAVPTGEAAADCGGEDGAGPGVDTVSTLQAAGGDRGWRLDAEGAAGGHIVPSSGLDGGETARALMTGEQGHRHDPTSATYVVDEVSALTTRHHADRGDSADLGKLVAAPTPILEVGARTGVSTDDPRAGMGVGEPGDPMFTLQASKQHGVAYAPEQAATLTAGVSASEGVNPPGRRQEDDVNLVAVESVTGEHTHALTSEGADASEDGTSRGTPIIAVPIGQDALRGGEGVAKTPSADAEGRVRLRDPGLGVGADGDPAQTVTAAGPGAVATFRKQRRAADPTDDETWVEGDVANTLNTFDGGDTRATEVVIEPETFALEPETGQGADLRARETDVSPAVTVTDHARTTDRGVRVTDPADATVRRLTPTECERLQGFPSAQELALVIEVLPCCDPLPTSAPADPQSLRSPSSVSPVAANGSSAPASPAGEGSRPPRRGADVPARGSARIDYAVNAAEIRSASNMSCSSASGADVPGSSHPATASGTTARLGVPTTQPLGLSALTGAAESPTRGSSTAPPSGVWRVALCGREIEDGADGAHDCTTVRNRRSTFTTWRVGLDSPLYASSLETWCCSVARAIAGSTPDATSAASSYEVTVRTLGWLDGLELSDSAMYRMLGNAVCVAVSAWTGWRLAAYLRGWRP